MSKDLKPTQENQIDLFGLDPLIDKNYSNTLEIHDLMSKYRYDKKIKYLVEASASKVKMVRQMPYKNIQIKQTVRAAQIERTLPDGTKQDVFVQPGAREEVIEDVLKKMATEKGRAILHEIEEGKLRGQKLVGLTFGLYEVFKECKRVKRELSYNGIREGLLIMHNANCTYESDDESISSGGTILPVMKKVNGGNDAKEAYFICFHPMVTDVIYSKSFRRYNYVTALSYRSNYTGLLYKRLCHRWTQCSIDNPYNILLSTMIQAWKEPAKNLYHDKETFVKVMDELVEKEVLYKYKMESKKDGKKITDWRFDLWPTEKFAKQIAANNKAFNKLVGDDEKLQLSN